MPPAYADPRSRTLDRTGWIPLVGQVRAADPNVSEANVRSVSGVNGRRPEAGTNP